MKTEMRMLDNGNYEPVVMPIQHECRSKDGQWECTQYAREMDTLYLEFEDEYDSGMCMELKVNFCPFCGFSVKPKA